MVYQGKSRTISDLSQAKSKPRLAEYSACLPDCHLPPQDAPHLSISCIINISLLVVRQQELLTNSHHGMFPRVLKGRCSPAVWGVRVDFR